MGPGVYVPTVLYRTMRIILGGLGLPLFPNYFLIISYSISYSYYLFILPKDSLLPIHFL